MKNGIPQLRSLYFIGSTFFTLHRLPLPAVFSWPQLLAIGVRNSDRRAERASLAFLWWTPPWFTVSTVCKTKQKAKSLSYFCKHRRVGYIREGKKARHLGAIVSSETPALHTHHKHIMPNNTDQLWEYHLGFRLCNLLKYRHLHSLECAYSLGKILQVIPQSIIQVRSWGLQ